MSPQQHTRSHLRRTTGPNHHPRRTSRLPAKPTAWLRTTATALVLTCCGTSTALAQSSAAPASPWTPDPALVAQLSNRPNHAFNYREENVPNYELPGVLGDSARGNAADSISLEAWQKRRESLMELFRDHVYGRRPDIQPGIAFRYDGAIEDPTGGKAVGKRIVVQVHHEGRVREFPFLLYVPAEHQGKVPLVVLINNREFPKPAELKETPSGFWPVDLLIEQGYATAVFHTSDVDPDRADGYEAGLRGFLANNRPRADHDWGSLSAWGWAASRVLDYALRHEPVDPNRTAVVGHSRGGKTALWAAAEDPRFAIAYSNESGCGGAALSRRRFGETIGRITSSFPHWFCPRLSTYTDREDQLPVDQHQLIALLAPRGVYVASAADDLWADPRGEYLAVVEAAPAFQLHDQTTITNRQMPALDQPVHTAATGYHIRPGKHNLTRHDWEYFLQFANQHFDR